MKRIRLFLSLYQTSTRNTLVVALALSVGLSVLDFLALVLLLPVFGVLMGDATTGTSASIPGFDISTQNMLVLALALLIVRTVAGFLYKLWWGRRVSEAEIYLSDRLLKAYAFAPFRYHLRRSSSDLLSRSVSHVNIASNAGLNGLALMVADATTVIGLAAALFVASPQAAAAVCGYLALLAGSFAVISRRVVTRQATRFSEHVGQVYGRATTMLRGIRDLTVAGSREVALDSIRASRTEMVRTQRNMAILTEVPKLILECALYAAALVGLLLVLNGPGRENNLAIVALYIVAGLRILPVIARGLGNTTQARTGIELGCQVHKELESVETMGSPAGTGQSAVPRHGSLAIRNVSFSYDAGAPIIQNTHLLARFGTFVAVVGPSGAGKSTFLSIILGLLQPDTGEVSYGGTDIGLANPNWFRHIAYVPQDTFILDDTVLNNVALGFSNPSREGVWAALDRAALGDVVRQFPEGLLTRLGESGSRLSVGQRQRLGIARALYREPAVLVLDEPSAALDESTEREVMATIAKLKGALTIVLVTHRMETTKKADLIVRLEGGTLHTQLVQPRQTAEVVGRQL